MGAATCHGAGYLPWSHGSGHLPWEKAPGMEVASRHGSGHLRRKGPAGMGAASHRAWEQPPGFGMAACLYTSG